METALSSVGPGLPPLGAAGTGAIEDGLIVARGPSAPLSELRLRGVPLRGHRRGLPPGGVLDLGALVDPGRAVRLAVP